jgi:hypothetical protein
MSPKEKAQELVDRFREFADGTNPETDRYSPNIEKQKAKQCALIAVDEILSDYKNYLMHENTEYKGLTYWNEVKKEIELL